MRFENIFQFIVPLTFFAIWALTSLFNREAQPLPPRPGRPLGPNGPRPIPLDTSRPVDRAAERSPRDPTMRWSKPSAPDRPPSRRPPTPGGLDDEVLIIRPEPSRPSPPINPSPRAGGAPPTRRGARIRPPVSAPPKRPDVQLPSALSRSMEHDVALPVNRPLVLDPLPQSIAAATATDTGLSAPPPAPPKDPPPLAASDMRLLIASPTKLREAIVLNELLRPPLSLRHSARRRP